MINITRKGVPNFDYRELHNKTREYALLIPIINEGDNILKELKRAKDYSISEYADIIICDGGSTDGSVDISKLEELDVNVILIKKDTGKQGAQLRMGMWWALKRGYKGIITIDGNNKDSIENVPKFIEKLEQGFSFVQGSRFVKGGNAINTPMKRLLAIKLIHAPIISITAGYHFTDTTNNFRAYSRQYLEDPNVLPFRDCFMTYELLAYLSSRASQLGYNVCEIPVTRAYPQNGIVPTKIRGIKGNVELIKILVNNLFGKYNP